MNKFYSYLFFVVILCGIYSCKKDNQGSNSNTTTPPSLLIIGKWLATKEHVKIYTTGGTLVKDTTDIFLNDEFDLAWNEIYNKDGSAYITTIPHGVSGSTITKVDTTSSSLTYSISGKNLNISEDGTYSYTVIILTLNSTDLEVEDTYTGQPDSRWKLDPNVTYKFVEDNYYSKQ